jgi:hypothetical protein
VKSSCRRFALVASVGLASLGLSARAAHALPACGPGTLASYVTAGGCEIAGVRFTDFLPEDPASATRVLLVPAFTPVGANGFRITLRAGLDLSVFVDGVDDVGDRAGFSFTAQGATFTTIGLAAQHDVAFGCDVTACAGALGRFAVFSPGSFASVEFRQEGSSEFGSPAQFTTCGAGGCSTFDLFDPDALVMAALPSARSTLNASAFGAVFADPGAGATLGAELHRIELVFEGTLAPSTVPEPATLALTAGGLLALAFAGVARRLR